MGNLVFFLYLFVKTLKVKKCKILFSEKYLSMLNFWILAFFGCLINNESNIYLKFLFRKLFISLYHGQWTAGLAGYRCIPTRHGFLVSDKTSEKVNRRQWSHWKDSEKQFFHCIRCTYMINKNTNVDRCRVLLGSAILLWKFLFPKPTSVPSPIHCNLQKTIILTQIFSSERVKSKKALWCTVLKA